MVLLSKTCKVIAVYVHCCYSIFLNSLRLERISYIGSGLPVQLLPEGNFSLMKFPVLHHLRLILTSIGRFSHNRESADVFDVLISTLWNGMIRKIDQDSALILRISRTGLPDDLCLMLEIAVSQDRPQATAYYHNTLRLCFRFRHLAVTDRTL